MRILVVDDDVLGAETLAELLRAQGHDAQWAVNADGALARMGLGGFDVLVIDEFMPGLDGVSLIRKTRSLAGWQDVPIVLLTAAADVPFQAMAADLASLPPATALQKPRCLDEILEAIERLRAPNPT